MKFISISDRHHFDNPVYSFNSYNKNDSLQPLNNVQKIQVKNNLTKKNNLDRQKLDNEEMPLSHGKIRIFILLLFSLTDVTRFIVYVDLFVFRSLQCAFRASGVAKKSRRRYEQSKFLSVY